VASGGWWQWECHHYHGWVDCFHFFAPGSMRITIRCHYQVGFLFFVFVARQQVPPLKNDNQTGIIQKLWWSVSRSWWWSVSGSWWNPEAGGIHRLVTIMAGLTVFIFCTWKHADYHMPQPPGWIFIFCFCGKATGTTTTMAIARCQFFQGTALLLLLVDFFALGSM